MVYLEWRQLANRVRAALKEPLRIILWAVGAFWLIGMVVLRIVTPKPHGQTGLPEPFASVIALGYFVFLGFMIALAAGGNTIGAFSSAADARFLIGSKLPERTVIVWLHLRHVAFAIIRIVWIIVLYATIYRTAGSVWGLVLTMIAAAGLAGAIPITTFRMASVRGTIVPTSIASLVIAIGVLGLIAIALGFADPTRFHESSQIALNIGAGKLLNLLVEGNRPALSIGFALVAGLIALSILGASDLYPELYAASTKAFSTRRKARRGFATVREYSTRGVRTSSTRWTGAWTILWKEWLGYRRAKYSLMRTSVGILICLAVGAAIGIGVERFHEPVMVYAVLINLINAVVIFATMASIQLGDDLRKPLWWLSGDPLYLRLCVWAVSTTWRFALILAVGAMLCGAIVHSTGLVVAAFPAMLLTLLYLRAVGLFTYSIFPSVIDQRGPLMFVKVLLTYALIMPPMLMLLWGALFAHDASLGLGGAAAIMLAEMAGLVAVAAGRIQNAGAAFAAAEAA